VSLNGFSAPITQLSSDDQHPTKSLPLVGLYSGTPEIAYVLLWRPFQPHIVLATGPGNPPAVQVWIGKTVGFGSRIVQIPNPLLHGGPNPDQYLSTRGFYWVYLDLSVPIPCSGYRVFLFMVAFRYPTANRKMLSLVHCSPVLTYWPPL